ncbi:MAG: hypothetical protein R3E31_20625 [Chloroflexota bacterium]|nr:hypothetical protein [Anaerolineales bacterium]MCB8965782.1 hypothetical protein [Ardenticatenaceae bacterium]
MMTQKTKDHNLVKLKVALATGGLVTTLIGAGLLGKAANALEANTATTESVVITNSGSVATTNIDALDSSAPADLDLSLEAVPTVAAPTFRSVPVARGRSSG